MTGSVTNIWRHPIKGIGVEAITGVRFESGRTMAWDRVWAVMHQSSNYDASSGAWDSKNSFNQGARSAALMAIKARVNENAGEITLTHPDLEPLTVDPDKSPDTLVAWLKPLIAENQPQPAGVVKATGRGMTDQLNPYISIIGTASLQALTDIAEMPLQQERFRANIWVDGLKPWEEFDWIGKTIRIGGATLRVDAPIGRCVATTSNPDTGAIDVNTVDLLRKTCGHKNLGVFAEVISGGDVNLSDGIEVLS